MSYQYDSDDYDREPLKTNANDRVAVEDYLDVLHRAERAEQLWSWLIDMYPTAGSTRAAQRAVERAVQADYDKHDIGHLGPIGKKS